MKVSSSSEEEQGKAIQYLESRGIAVHEGQYDGLHKVARIMRDQDRYMATVQTMRDRIVFALRRFAATWQSASQGWVIVVLPNNGTGRSSIASHVVKREDAIALQRHVATLDVSAGR